MQPGDAARRVRRIAAFSPLGRGALAWVLSRGDHVVAIPGTGRMAHLEENIARWHWQPSAQVLETPDALINQNTVVGARYGESMKLNVDTEDFA